MNNLLAKSLKQLTIYASVIFALSIPCYFLLVDWIWLKELDENNYLIAERIENEFNDQNITDEKLAEAIDFWNQIQPGSTIVYIQHPNPIDSTYTIKRQNQYSKTKTIDRFRGLRTTIKINNRNYRIVVETNVEEREETIVYIATITLFFFGLLIIGFWILNRRFSKKLWQPFQDTLQKLKSFKINSQEPIAFIPTDTTEFSELNTALDKLLQHSMASYKTQKEFTENASHELQTPLAILKHKVDMLLQSDGLTERQYNIAEEMNKALTRSSRINKNLLLLAKIENSQFNNPAFIDFSEILVQSMNILQEHFIEKNLVIETDIVNRVETKAETSLTEVLINNLLINAIRHNHPGGTIKVTLSQKKFTVANSGEKSLDANILFKRFSRSSLDNSGSGLGLSIVQEISRIHNWQTGYQFENGQHIFYVLM